MPDRVANQAFSDSPDWWGPRWIGGPDAAGREHRASLSVLDLIDAGTLDPMVAAILWELIARRSSIIVVAGPSGAGKTTMLTALADFLPPTEQLLPVRGVFDPLRFLDDPEVEPQATTAMVNEISPHLPIYLWGPGVGRLLTSPRRFRIFATAHASSAQDLVAQLASYPLRLPLTGVARLDVVVRIEARRDVIGIHRAVTEVTALDPSPRDGIVLRPLLNASGNSLDVDSARAWLDETSGRGVETGLGTRHNVLLNRGAVFDAFGKSDSGLRNVFAAAYARAAGDT